MNTNFNFNIDFNFNFSINAKIILEQFFLTWPDLTWPDLTWPDLPCPDPTCPLLTYLDLIWSDLTCPHLTWFDLTWLTSSDLSSLVLTYPNLPSPNFSWLVLTVLLNYFCYLKATKLETVFYVDFKFFIFHFSNLSVINNIFFNFSMLCEFKVWFLIFEFWVTIPRYVVLLCTACCAVL